MINMQDVREAFITKYKNKDFTLDKTGVRTVELLGYSYIADEEVLFGTLNREYAEKELKWYESQSLNVYDMPNPPKIWRQVCDKDGFINSNYGWMIFSKENGEQYKHCLRELRKNVDSRRAMMIYQRPSMQEDYNRNGMSDFCCTNTVQVCVRNQGTLEAPEYRLHYIVNQRSCDAIFGLKNDLFWHRHVMDKLVQDLQDDYKGIQKGNLIHQVGSLHVYERHWKFIEEYL